MWRGLDAQDGSGEGVLGGRFPSDGSPRGDEFLVNTFTPFIQREPAVAAFPDGAFVVVWNGDQQDGSNSGVFAQRYTSNGTPTGSEFQVNTHTFERQYQPAVATHASGEFTVVWSSFRQDDPSASRAGIFAQHFDVNGQPAGSEFQVNTYTTESQIAPAIAADASENITVVWQSRDQDGDDWGVFGQRLVALAERRRPIGEPFARNVVPPASRTHVGTGVVAETTNAAAHAARPRVANS